jgi:hypothetical protein
LPKTSAGIPTIREIIACPKIHSDLSHTEKAAIGSSQKYDAIAGQQVKPALQSELCIDDQPYET